MKYSHRQHSQAARNLRALAEISTIPEEKQHLEETASLFDSLANRAQSQEQQNQQLAQALTLQRSSANSIPASPAFFKHVIGVLCVALGVWGLGFLYNAVTLSWGNAWDHAELAIQGIVCLIVAVILFRIWNRAMGNMPWLPIQALEVIFGVAKKKRPLPARESAEHPVRVHPLMPNPTPEGFGKYLREAPASKIKESNDFLAGIEDGKIPE